VKLGSLKLKLEGDEGCIPDPGFIAQHATGAESSFYFFFLLSLAARTVYWFCWLKSKADSPLESILRC
jgi:hypothetical protein